MTPRCHDNRCWCRASRRQEIGAAFCCRACSEGLLGRAGLVARGCGQPPCLPTPQLMTFSQRPAADTQDLHLPQGTAAMGTAVLAAPNSLSALGIFILVWQEQPLYPETLSAASAKPETQRAPGDKQCRELQRSGVVPQHVSFHWVTVQRGRGALDS